MSWTHLPIHVIDFEGHLDYGIVEFGVVSLQGGVVRDTVTRICQAKGDISFRETRLHRIRKADTENTKPFDAEREHFFALRQSGPLAAHHAGTEDRLIRHVWPAPPFSPDFLRGEGEVATWAPWLDTRVLYQTLYPNLDRYKLENLITIFNLQPELDALAAEHCPPNRCRYHCALYDALASAMLILRIAKEPGWGTIPLASLLVHAQPQNKRQEQEELF